MNDGDRSIGDALRGSRLGFRWVPSLARYLRLRDVEGGFAFDLATPAGIRSLARPKAEEHRVWWEGDDGAFIVSAIARHADGLAASYATIVLDDDGERIG